MTRKLSLLAKESKYLRALARLHCKPSRRIGGGVVEPVSASSDIADFVKGFWTTRGVGATAKEVSLCRFSHVNMHIDGIHPKNYRTLIIPVKGRGELGHIVGGEIKYYDFDARRNLNVVVLNDNRLHAFISYSPVCWAILVAIRDIETNKLLK